MSDIGASQFYSGFWDYYVAIITIVSVVGCAVFLWLQGRRTVKAQVNAKGEIETTGHVWDGDLQEYHNPMPRWWIWLFYLTVLFSIVYLVLYPGLGTQWQGVLKWTQIGQYDGEVKRPTPVSARSSRHLRSSRSSRWPPTPRHVRSASASS